MTALIIGSNAQARGTYVQPMLRASFSESVKTASPAVVNIYTEKEVMARTAHPFFDDPFFNQLLNQGLSGRMKKRIERSLGSGVVVTEDGYIVTNYHVVKDATSIRVIFHDRTERAAEFIAADKNSDIAIMKIILNDEQEEAKFDYINFADSDEIDVGDIVLALGNPFGVGQSVSLGIISATGRSNLGSGHYENYIQTDAAINPGNSGGALIDIAGKLVGVNTAIYSRTGGSQGIGFAIPANAVRVTLNSVLTTGKITRPWFGAAGQDVTEDLAEQLQLDRPYGVLVNEIVKESPASRANLQIGDIILSFDGKEIDGMAMLNARISSSYVGENYNLNVWREGESYISEVMLGALPDRLIEEQYTVRGTNPLSGYMFEPLSPALNDELNMPLNTEGVVVVGVASRRGFGILDLKEGDIITSINKKAIRTMKDLQTAVSRRPRAWQVVYERAGKTHRVIVQ
jgi:Do/DeqQ family serine protease